MLCPHQTYTSNVAECRGDSDAARTLGLRTYLSPLPVRMPQGQLYGTPCAASTTEQAMQASTMGVLQLFAGLIGQHVERELRQQELQQRNRELATHALHDALTGLPNWRALLEELPRIWSRAQRDGRSVLLAFIDLDHFKSINDHYGHEAGDQLLCTLARQLRDSDFTARFGCDEFVMLGTGPMLSDAARNQADGVDELQQRLQQASQCEIALPWTLLRYPGASVGVVAIDPANASPEQALEQADAAMYLVKRARSAPTLR